jgi:hypothetical protein
MTKVSKEQEEGEEAENWWPLRVAHIVLRGRFAQSVSQRPRTLRFL